MKLLSFIAAGLLWGAEWAPAAETPYRMLDVPGVNKVRLLPPGEGNPRNSEGDFIKLRDGRLLFVYTHFTGGGSDHARAHLAGRISADHGLTWTGEDRVILPNEGDWNIMSVSLLRLQSGEIALFYMRKNSLEDCRPLMRLSRDEARTWSEPTAVIPDSEKGYYVLNNDRVVQLEDGRLLLPVALHNRPGDAKPDWAGRIFCYHSDDRGRTWRRSERPLIGRREDGSRVTLQEPGVVSLKDGRILMFMRTDAGFQYQSWSSDRGLTWTEPQTGPIPSPQSPATIERIPGTGDLLLVWNDHRDIAPERRKLRTPFSVAISRDEGLSWERVGLLEDDVHGWYCYSALAFVEDRVVLGHCAGDRRKGGLNTTQITSFPVTWLYRGSR